MESGADQRRALAQSIWRVAARAGAAIECQWCSPRNRRRCSGESSLSAEPGHFSSAGRSTQRSRFSFTRKSRCFFLSRPPQTKCDISPSTGGARHYRRRSRPPLSRFQRWSANFHKVAARIFRRRISASAVPVARRSRMCAPDCLRKCGEPATGPWNRTPSGIRSARSTRRGSMAIDAANFGRNECDRASWRMLRSAHRALESGYHSRDLSRKCVSLSGNNHRPSGSSFHHRHHYRLRIPRRHLAGVAHFK